MIGAMNSVNALVTRSLVAGPLAALSLAAVAPLELSGCSTGQSAPTQITSASSSADKRTEACRAYVQTLSESEKNRG